MYVKKIKKLNLKMMCSALLEKGIEMLMGCSAEYWKFRHDVKAGLLPSFHIRQINIGYRAPNKRSEDKL